MFTKVRASRIGSLFVFLALVACGGGGDGGSSIDPGVIGHASDYWQVSSGSTWLYEGRDATTSTDYRDRATVGGSMVLAGRTLIGLQYTNMLNVGESPEFRSFGSEGIRTYLEMEPTDPSLSYIELPAEIRKETFRAFDMTEPITGGTLRVTIDVTVAGLQDISLPAGEFRGALKTTQTFTVTLTTSTGTGTGASTAEFWYAKGIGVIKRVLTDPNLPAGANAFTEQLAGVMTANVKAGVVGEYDLLQNLSSGSSAISTGRPGAASDGSGFLVVARKVDGSSFAGRLVATYVEGDGTLRFADRVIVDNMGPTSPYTDYGPIHVAWDGARFWVIAEGTTGGVLRQRVTSDGAVLDGVNGTVLISDGSLPGIAIESGKVLVAYSRYDMLSGRTLYANAYNTDGSLVADSRIIAVTGPTSALPSVTGHAGQFLVTYEKGDPSDLMATRIDMTGWVMDPTGIAVSTAALSQWGSEVTGWGSGGYVAVWQDSRVGPYQYNIMASRMTSDGSLLDGPAATGGVVLCGLAIERFGTAAADGASGTLIGWTVGSYATSSSPAAGIYGRLYKPDAEFTTAAAPTVRYGLLSQQDYATRLMYPVAAPGSEGFLVAWVRNTESVGTMKSVRGALVFPRYGT